MHKLFDISFEKSWNKTYYITQNYLTPILDQIRALDGLIIIIAYIGKLYLLIMIVYDPFARSPSR